MEKTTEELNKKINSLQLKEKEITMNIPKNDYIKYYLDNKDILFDTEYERDVRFKDLTQLLDSYSNYIYAYFIYFIFLFFAFSHYLYITINDIRYIYIMLSIIMLYFSYGYISYLFRNSDAQ